MTPAEALARRATQAAGWRFVPGMATLDGLRVVAVGDEGTAWTLDVMADPGFTMGRVPADALPDLADPATIGCVLALVRERYPDAYAAREGRSWWAHDAEGTPLCAFPGAYETRQRGESCCVGGPCHRPAAGATEAEALVLALEAAGVPDAR